MNIVQTARIGAWLRDLIVWSSSSHKVSCTCQAQNKQVTVILKVFWHIWYRDHRKLGTELDLFSLRETTGPGLVLWHPKGAIVRHIIETYWKERHLAKGYDLVNTPHVAKIDLWKTSGHLDFYKESMFNSMEVCYLTPSQFCLDQLLLHLFQSPRVF